ncbi:hypothetical protein PG988_012753 [Apiospora saccharicola]
MATYTCNSNYHTRGSCPSKDYHNTNDRQRPPRRSQIHWAAGQLAFLTSSERYNDEDYCNLIQSKEIPPKATNHPCVILRRDQGSDYCIITPVSAFSASEETNFLPPWKQRFHQKKARQHFRSFRGSESSSSSSDSIASSNDPCSQLLELRDGRTMPKPKASWIYIEHIYVVPVHLLIPFRKPGGGWEPREPRQLTDDSLAALKKHIAREAPDLLKSKLNKMDQFNRNASSSCNKPDAPQQCSRSALKLYGMTNQTYKAIRAN